MVIFFQIAVNGILSAAIYALIAVGLSFLYSTAKIFHLAHGAAVLGAGYAFWWSWAVMAWHPVFSVAFAVLVSAAIGFLMNELVYENLRKRGARGLGYLIATLALLMLGTGLILSLFGAAPKTFQFQTESFDFSGIRITALQIWTIIIAAALIAAFFWVSKFTKFGKAMRATADNETAAEVLGINTRNIRRLAFVFSSALAAAAGILVGLEFNLDPKMGVLIAVKGFTAAVIGGVGSVPGAILGSLIIGFGEHGAVWFLGAGFRNAVAFILLFAFLLFKPNGIFGKRT